MRPFLFLLCSFCCGFVSFAQNDSLLQRILQEDEVASFKNLPVSTQQGVAILPQAIQANAVQICHYLIAENVPINQLDAQGIAPLHYAVQQDDTAILQALLEAGAQVDIPTGGELGGTPLMWACAQEDAQAAALLIQHEANINAIDRQGDPVINWAAYYGHPKVLALLVSKNIDLSVHSKHGDAADVLLRLWHTDTLLQIFRGTTLHQAIPQETEAYFELAAKQDLSSLEQRLLESQLPNQKDGFGSTLLHHAAMNGRLDLLEILLRHQAELNILNRVGQTPLCLAASKGHASIIEKLLEAGADPNYTDTLYQLTPLIGSAVSGDANIAQALLQAGAHLDHQETVNETTALHWAIFRQNEAAAQYLLEQGANYKLPLFAGNMNAFTLVESMGMQQLGQQIKSYQQANKLLLGSWAMEKIEYLYPDTIYTADKPAPGIFVLSPHRYVIQYHPSNKSRTPFEDFTNPTCDELREAFQNLVFNTGNYHVTDQLLTAHPDIARVPGFEGARQVYHYTISEDRLLLTLKDETYPDGTRPQWVGKISVRFTFRSEK